MANTKYLDFLGSVWENLHGPDKERFGELWHGYEQIMATIYQSNIENDMNVAVADLLLYQMQRWLPYQFTSADATTRPAVYTSTQDLSYGVRTDTRYLLRFLIDNTIDVEVDIRTGGNPVFVTEIVDKINTACGFEFARGIFEDTIVQLQSPTAGPNSGIQILIPSDPNKDISEFVLGVATLPYTVDYYPYAFSLPYQRIADIPDFRTKVRDESPGITILTKNVDYRLEANSVIAFKQLPPEFLWAKRTYVNQETPWNNFGFLMGVYQPNDLSYLSIIQGLWHAFWTGPRPDLIRTSLYLLFGLPVSLEGGIVTYVSSTEIEVTSDSGLIKRYQIPSELSAVVTPGQRIPSFTPLVDGISVFDKINLPGFIQTEIGRYGIQRFLTEDASRGEGDTDESKALVMLEEHCFLPQISVNCFISQAISLKNIKLFLNTIRPIHKTFFPQIIVGEFKDYIEFKEQIGLHVSIDVTPNLDSNQTTFLDETTLTSYETTDNEGLNLDSDVALIRESADIEVYSFGVLIDSFAA